MTQLDIVSYVEIQSTDANDNESKSTDLIVIGDASSLNAVEIFNNGGLDDLFDKVSSSVKGEVYDISTPEGRKRIGSVARKIGSTKKALEKLADSLTEDWKQKVRAVNSSKNEMIEKFDSLRDEIRKPLDEFNAKEEKRTATHENRLETMRNQANFDGAPPPNSSAIREAIETLKKISFFNIDNTPVDWEEFSSRANATYTETMNKLNFMLEERIKYEQEQEELEKLRKEKIERDRKEYEEKLKADAAEKARKEAEDKAAKEKAEAEAKAEADRIAAEKERARIQKEKDDAEKARIDGHKSALDQMIALGNVSDAMGSNVILDRKDSILSIFNGREWQEFYNNAKLIADDSNKVLEEAYKSAKIREDMEKAESEKAAADAAIAAEEERQRKLRDAAAAEQKRRDDDMEHRKKINNEAKYAILKVAAILDAEERAQAIVTAIANGEIPHVSIKY